MVIEKRTQRNLKREQSDENYSNTHDNRTQKRVSNTKEVPEWIRVILGILAAAVAFLGWKMYNFENTLSSKINNLSYSVDKLEDNGNWQVYTVTYGGGSDTSNNLSRIGEKSLGFPTYLKGKKCYVLGSKISGADGGTIRGYLGKNYNGSMFRFADNYEAEINNFEEKIEITKWNGSSNVMLTKSERDNLYFSLNLLCH